MESAENEPDRTAVDWIGRLIAFDTTSRNSNLGLIEEVRDRLRLPHDP